jgi:hypothetical protein
MKDLDIGEPDRWQALTARISKSKAAGSYGVVAGTGEIREVLDAGYAPDAVVPAHLYAEVVCRLVTAAEQTGRRVVIFSSEQLEALLRPLCMIELAAEESVGLPAQTDAEIIQLRDSA